MALTAFKSQVTEVNGRSLSRRSSLELDLIEQKLIRFGSQSKIRDAGYLVDTFCLDLGLSNTLQSDGYRGLTSNNEHAKADCTSLVCRHMN